MHVNLFLLFQYELNNKGLSACRKKVAVSKNFLLLTIHFCDNGKQNHIPFWNSLSNNTSRNDMVQRMEPRKCS